MKRDSARARGARIQDQSRRLELEFEDMGWAGYDDDWERVDGVKVHRDRSGDSDIVHYVGIFPDGSWVEGRTPRAAIEACERRAPLGPAYRLFILEAEGPDGVWTPACWVLAASEEEAVHRGGGHGARAPMSVPRDQAPSGVPSLRALNLTRGWRS